MKKINNEEKNKNKVIEVLVIILVAALVLFLIISKIFGNFSSIALDKNNKTVFSVKDLTVNNLKFGDSEEVVLKELGNPLKTERITNNSFDYKVLQYKDLKLTLKENYSDYILVKAEITSSKYKTSRNIRVKNSIKSVMNKYKIDNSRGTYLYGNYTVESLSNKEITDNIYLGVRNDKEVVYINRDSITDNTNVNVARLNISYSFGKVNKIVWSYDIE